LYFGSQEKTTRIKIDYGKQELVNNMQPTKEMRPTGTSRLPEGIYSALVDDLRFNLSNTYARELIGKGIEKSNVLKGTGL